MEGDSVVIGREHIAVTIKDRFGVDAKAEQIDTLQALIDDKKDVILIARTGFGKSIPFQAAPLLFSPAKTALILMPLKALEEEQCEKLKAVSGCRPFVLNGDTHTSGNLRMIREGHFTHVFTSPEIAISKSFNQDVLRHPTFYLRLCLLAIDEAHLVAEWRDFRPSYYDLGILRSRLPDGIPVLAGSATLDSTTLGIVRDRCGFKADHRLIKTALDRPEIYIQFSPLQEAAQPMLDLQWVLPAQATSPLDIPKTIVFMDSIRAIKNAAALMRTWMNRLAYPMEARRWVSPFFADMATSDKERIAANFRLPSNECMGPRILFATDAYGLGIDNADVERVVQWLLPSTIAKLYQRMGRAMRCGLGQGHFTLLYPPWCLGPKSGGGEEERPGDKVGGADQKAKDADRRRDLAPGIYVLVNAQPGGKCIRRVGLELLEDEVYRTLAYTKAAQCCSCCDQDFQVTTDCNSKLAKTPSKDSLRRPWILRRLRERRRAKALAVFHDSYLAYFPSLIMPDSVVGLLADWGEYIHDETSMRRWVGQEWDAIHRYHGEIVAILEEAHTLDNDRGVIFDEWVQFNAVKRKRIPDPDHNVAGPEFNSRRLSWLISNGLNTTAESSTGRKRGRQRASPSKGSVTKRVPAGSNAADLRFEGKETPADPIPSTPTVSACPDGSQPSGGGDVSRSTPPRRPRQALQERSPNVVEELSPSRVGRVRRLPAKFTDNW